mmetsp:Transcript_19961/g.40120  ORF Transcript_19961/g.40120 Transcript_19961/m.40120 type:complete len:116 (-) Transcript_19961:99-446(-)
MDIAWPFSSLFLSLYDCGQGERPSLRSVKQACPLSCCPSILYRRRRGGSERQTTKKTRLDEGRELTMVPKVFLRDWICFCMPVRGCMMGEREFAAVDGSLMESYEAMGDNGAESI